MVMLFVDIVIAFFIDLLLGDPHWMPHPVKFTGWLVKKFEGLLRQLVEIRMNEEGETADRAKIERQTGALLTISVVAATFLATLVILALARLIHPVLFHIINIYFIYAALATRCLADEAAGVREALLSGDLQESRKRLSMLVGRDTEELDENEIIRGVVETTAENTVDGIISPLLYAVAGSFFGIGAPLVWAFKAISTLDSMVGYRNEEYENFGKVSARTDDVANYIPARLSGLIIAAGAFLSGFDFVKSFRIMRRDRRNHKSPNCAWPEAAFAGALGIKIGGSNSYFGQIVEKPTIGDADNELTAITVQKAITLMYAAAGVTLVLGAGVGLLIGPGLWIGLLVGLGIGMNFGA